MNEFLKTHWRLVAGWALIAIGALLILLGWIGVSDEPEVARQLSYLASGGLGGLAAAIVGVGLLISEDLRSERKRLGRIEAGVLDVKELLLSTPQTENGTRKKATSRRR